MKIPKKHATQTACFVYQYLQERYWPMEDLESELLSNAVGFGQYHNLYPEENMPRLLERLGAVGCGPPPAKRDCARLDLTHEQMGALIEMVDEYDFNSNCNTREEYEPIDFCMKSCVRYFAKEVLNEDSV